MTSEIVNFAISLTTRSFATPWRTGSMKTVRGSRGAASSCAATVSGVRS